MTLSRSIPAACPAVRISDFDYTLPRELIAQEALPARSDARLLILDRARGTVEHRTFRDIPGQLEPGDVLVLNDTLVLPARLFAKRKTGGRVEILLLKPAVPVQEKVWQVLVKPSGRVAQNEELVLDGRSAADRAPVMVTVLDAPDHRTGIRHIRFQTDENMEALLARIGRIPLPPYIDREDTVIDRELYQTVFDRRPGAVASPTAGLHFDHELLDQIRRKGVQICFITLHVGYGTFQPVQEEDLSRHRIHEEYFEIPDETAGQINVAKTDGRQVVACGTTVVRALESAAVDTALPEMRSKAGAFDTSKHFETGRSVALDTPSSKDDAVFESTGFRRFEMRSKTGMTGLFIYPPYSFKFVDRMITNFHLPGTTLLMLASAFAGHGLLMDAYREAIGERYRFYSYGDAMLIL